MQEQVDALHRFRLKKFSRNLDVVARCIGFRAKFGDDVAIHGHQA